MRRFDFAPLVLAFAAACSSPVLPEAADIAGAVAVINPTTSTLGVRENNVVCTISPVSAPCVSVSVRVSGKIFMQAPNGNLREIRLEAIPMGAEVLVWTKGRTAESYPSQAEGVRVVVRQPEGISTAGRLSP